MCGRAAATLALGDRRVHLKLEADVDYEIEVQELKDRRRSFGRLGVGALVACVLVLALRHLM